MRPREEISFRQSKSPTEERDEQRNRMGREMLLETEPEILGLRLRMANATRTQPVAAALLDLGVVEARGECNNTRRHHNGDKNESYEEFMHGGPPCAERRMGSVLLVVLSDSLADSFSNRISAGRIQPRNTSSRGR